MMIQNRRHATTTEMRKLQEMADAGFSRAEASRALGRHQRFAYYWAAKIGIEWRLRRPGRPPLIQPSKTRSHTSSDL